MTSSYFLVILFDALTQFLRKQALKGANEIINYYSRKYKNIAKHTGNSVSNLDSIELLYDHYGLPF